MVIIRTPMVEMVFLADNSRLRSPGSLSSSHGVGSGGKNRGGPVIRAKGSTDNQRQIRGKGNWESVNFMNKLSLVHAANNNVMGETNKCWEYSRHGHT